MIVFVLSFICFRVENRLGHVTAINTGQVSAVGSAARLEFGSWQVPFPGLAHSFTSCQLLVKGWTLRTGYQLKPAQEKYGQDNYPPRYDLICLQWTLKDKSNKQKLQWIIFCVSSNFTKPTSGEVYLSDVSCEGYGGSILHCDHSGWRTVQKADYNHTVGVYCFENGMISLI